MTTKKTEKKTVTVKFTADEAKWLIQKLERIAQDQRQEADGGSCVYGHLTEAFKADSLIDRIESEQ